MTLLPKLIASLGIAFDVSAALVITVPVICEPQSERDRKAKALGRGEIGVAVWAGEETMKQFDAATLHHRSLFGADRRRALISTTLLLAGVVCSAEALWMS